MKAWQLDQLEAIKCHSLFCNAHTHTFSHTHLLIKTLVYGFTRLKFWDFEMLRTKVDVTKHSDGRNKALNQLSQLIQMIRSFETPHTGDSWSKRCKCNKNTEKHFLQTNYKCFVEKVMQIPL